MKRWTVAVVILALAALVTSSASAAPPPQSPHETTVGVMIDSEDGGTSTLIDCGKDGSFSTVDGDGTLFMANRLPHRMTCVITIRSND
jgi:hypothetical protein